jgi:hypothetical protein
MTSNVPDTVQLLCIACLGLIAGASLVRPLREAVTRRRLRRIVARRLRAIAATACGSPT